MLHQKITYFSKLLKNKRVEIQQQRNIEEYQNEINI